MDSWTTRARSVGAALVFAAAAVVSSPMAAHAQEQQQDQMPTVDHDRLAVYAKVHYTIGTLREEYQGILGRIHDTDSRERTRQEMDEKIAKVYQDQGMTEQEYDQITLEVSFDGKLRAEFDKMMADLTASSPS